MSPAAGSIEAYLPVLYRAAGDTAAWNAVLALLCERLPADAAAVLAMGPELQTMLFVEQGLHNTAKDRFLEASAYAAGEPGDRSAFGLGVATQEQAGGALYPHWAEARPAATALYPRVTLTVFRSRGGSAFCLQEHDLLRQLSPHLTTVLHLGHQLQQVQQRSALLQHLSHGFDLAYMLLNSVGRPLLMSDAARAILQRKDGLHLQHGAICIESQTEQAEFLRLLQAACAPAGNHGFSDAALRVSRSAGLPVYLLLRSLPAAEGTPCAMVILHDPEERPAPRTVALRLLYRLLPSEIRLADSLVAGHDVKQAAARMRITENSARTLLKSVFRKTGVKSQAGLLRTILSLPAD